MAMAKRCKGCGRLVKEYSIWQPFSSRPDIRTFLTENYIYTWSPRLTICNVCKEIILKTQCFRFYHNKLWWAVEGNKLYLADDFTVPYLKELANAGLEKRSNV